MYTYNTKWTNKYHTHLRIFWYTLHHTAVPHYATNQQLVLCHNILSFVDVFWKTFSVTQYDNTNVLSKFRNFFKNALTTLFEKNCNIQGNEILYKKNYQLATSQKCIPGRFEPTFFTFLCSHAWLLRMRSFVV